MAKFFAAIVILVVLLVFNPGIDAHREALLPYVEKSMDEAYKQGNWLSKFGLWIAGDDLKSIVLDSVCRESYGIFSTGHIDNQLVTFGILGYVHVIE